MVKETGSKSVGFYSTQVWTCRQIFQLLRMSDITALCGQIMWLSNKVRDYSKQDEDIQFHFEMDEKNILFHFDKRWPKSDYKIFMWPKPSYKATKEKKRGVKKIGDELRLAAGILLFSFDGGKSVHISSLSISHVFHSRLLFLLLVAAQRINFQEV